MSLEKEDTMPPEDAPPHTAGESVEESTGLPWLPTWTAVYWFVFGCFVVFVGLLAALTVVFS
jgi:hypothetical protein